MTRPRGGDRRRAGDRETVAAIVFAAASGCTWRRLPPVFGPSPADGLPRFAQWTVAPAPDSSPHGNTPLRASRRIAACTSPLNVGGNRSDEFARPGESHHRYRHHRRNT
ncbi:transposase [Streptomyces sp. NPDC004609]|uniref:transposase n=1 Tax=Streptomyces sp. NPDC004609 TaxID=3364704 RepID=UPI0036AFBB4D